MTIKRFKRFTSLKTRKRLNEYRKQESPRIKLQRLWHQDKKKLKIKSLLYIVQNIKHNLLQKDAIIEFLDRENLNFDNFYHMLNLSKDVLQEDKALQKKFLKQCFDICTPDNLVELGEIGEAEAIKELRERIKEKSISNRKALQVTIRLFEITTNAKARMILWTEIKGLDPNEGDLKYIIDLPSMYALPKMISDAQKLLKKKNRKPDGRILQKIERTIQEIEKGQK